MARFASEIFHFASEINHFASEIFRFASEIIASQAKFTYGLSCGDSIHNEILTDRS